MFPSDPQISPDGRQVAFVLTRVVDEADKDKDAVSGSVPRPRYHSAVHLFGGEQTRQLTLGEGRDTSPRWSPDGRQLLFTSDRSGKAQLYLLPLDGGEPRQLTRFTAGVSGGQWSPDGRHIAFLSLGDWKDEGAERGEARVIERLHYKANGAGFLPGEVPGLYVQDTLSGEPRLVYRHSVDIDEFAWRTPGSLLFIAARDEAARANWESEVFELELRGEARRVTNWASNLHSLAPHPSGERFAALGYPRDKTNTEDTHVFEFDRQGGVRRIDEHVDVPAGNLVSGDCHVGEFPGGPVWVGDTLRLPYTVGGSCGLFDLEGGQRRDHMFTPGTVVAAFSANERGQAYLQESEAAFPEVYLNGRQVTQCGEALGDFPRRQAVRVTVNEGGQEVEGWVLGAEQAGAPALLAIHGGPHTAYGHGFMHEFQLLAGRGYAVCYGNPRGSVGYGQAHSAAIFGRWGSVDYADLMAFFSACLSTFPGLDASRAGVMGGSYGGYMTNWIIGHTNRFKVAVTDRSICNLVSFGGTSDIAPRFWRDELGLEFIRSADIEGLWQMSPLCAVERVQTPCLIVHAEEDHRCPIEQAEQWFTALALRGVRTRFVRFPGENHELSRSGRPDRRVARLEEYLQWLDQHLRAEQGSSGASGGATELH